MNALIFAFAGTVYALCAIWCGVATVGHGMIWLDDGQFSDALSLAVSLLCFIACAAIAFWCFWSAKA